MALTILTLFYAAALVSDIGINSVTPRAPLVPVRVSAVILLQSIAAGWQKPAGSRVGRRAARNLLPWNGHSQDDAPPLSVPLPSSRPHCSCAIPHCSLPIPHCPMLPRVGAMGQPGTRGHLWSCGVIACQCWQRSPFSVVACVPR